MNKNRLKFFNKALLFTAAMTSALFIHSNTAKADEFALLNDLSLKDSNGDAVDAFKRGAVFNGKSLNEEKVLLDYQFGQYEVESKYLLQLTKSKEMNFTIEKDTGFFAKPSLFTGVLDKLNTDELPLNPADIKILDLRLEESVAGWKKIELPDGRQGWILEKFIQKVEAVESLKNIRYAQLDIERDGETISRGSEVNILGVTEDGYKVDYNGREFSVKDEEVSITKPEPLIIPSNKSLGQVIDTNATGVAKQLLEFAQTKLGLPYVWGGDGGEEIGYDCSGFTKAVFESIGISLPRTAATQSAFGTTVAFESMQPGDLLYFETYKPGVSHVAIYMGDGKMIHAGGDRVQIQSIYTDYYVDRYLFSKRLL